MLVRALDAAEQLRSAGVGVRVLDAPTIKPFDVDAIRRESELTGVLVTAEEHSVVGGLGGAVAEALAATRPAPLRESRHRRSLRRHGSVADLMRRIGLTSDAIVSAVKRAIQRR